MRIGLLLASLALLSGGALAAQSNLAANLSSKIQVTRSLYVERHDNGERVLEPANILRRGDKVVLVMRWSGASEAPHTTLASKIPAQLAFQRSGRTPSAVSIDGGESWGRLGELHRDGRIATAEDVTHLRWNVPASSGTLTYSAIVR